MVLNAGLPDHLQTLYALDHSTASTTVLDRLETKSKKQNKTNKPLIVPNVDLNKRMSHNCVKI